MVNSIYPYIVSWAKCNHKLYFKSLAHPYTYCFDMVNETLEVMQEPMGTDNPKICGYMDAVAVDNYIIFTPYLADHISVLNTVTNEWIYILKGNKLYYKRAHVNDGKAYLIPDNGEIKDILIASPSRKEFIRGEEVFRGDVNEKVFLEGDAALYEEYLIVPIRGMGRVAYINCKDNSVRNEKIPDADFQISTIVNVKDEIWFTGDSDEIIIVKKNGNRKCLKLDAGITGDIGWNSRFSKGIVVGEYVYFAPLFYRSCIRIHIVTHEIQKMLEMESSFISWGIMTYDNIVFFNEFSPDLKRIQNYWIDENGNVQADVKVFDESHLDHPIYGEELYPNMLEKYINMLLDN